MVSPVGLLGPAENAFAKDFGGHFIISFFVFIVVNIWFSVGTQVTFELTNKKKKTLDHKLDIRS